MIPRRQIVQFPTLALTFGCLCALGHPVLPLVRAADFDLVIRRGRIVDGTGAPARWGDLGIRDGRIAAVGRNVGKGFQEIDAKGAFVAPGFIDVHTHSEDVLDVPFAQNFLRMGVTTIVTGNCGGSRTDVGPFLQSVDRKVSLNVATLIGHNSVRSKAMGGSFNRPPTVEEQAAMRSLVKQAMADGAVGLSTGLIYLPGTFSTTEEIIGLAKETAVAEGLYVSHMRNEGKEIISSIDELCRIAKEAGLPAHISHIKCSGKPAWGLSNSVLDRIERARAEGMDITQDQYMYPASSTSLGTVIPASYREGGGDAFRGRLNDPTIRTKLVEEMKANLMEAMREDYSYAVIATYKKDRSLQGLSVKDAARKVKGNDSLQAQIDLVLEIEASGGASAVFHSMNEEDLRRFLQHPNTMIASDAGVRKLGEGHPHPRGYGNNARCLATYCRELGLLRNEEAVRRMTSLPAATFRLKDRGVIREGAWADLVIFSPESVKSPSTFEDPHHYAEGFSYVVVNGTPVIVDGKHTGVTPGRAVRRGH